MTGYIVLITTPFKLLKPITWWKAFKRKISKNDYDTVCFSVEIDKKIIIYQYTFLGYLKIINLEEWKKSKYQSRIIPINKGKELI